MLDFFLSRLAARLQAPGATAATGHYGAAPPQQYTSRPASGAAPAQAATSARDAHYGGSSAYGGGGDGAFGHGSTEPSATTRQPLAHQASTLLQVGRGA
jgi:hypothetical protein